MNARIRAKQPCRGCAVGEQDPDYEVGYKKPPRHTQFEPGQSGNPKGRPKKTKDLDKLLDAELSQPLRIVENGEARMLTKRELIIKTLIRDAIKGNAQALRIVLPFMSKIRAVDEFVLNDEDRAAFEALMGRDVEADDD